MAEMTWAAVAAKATDPNQSSQSRPPQVVKIESTVSQASKKDVKGVTDAEKNAEAKKTAETKEAATTEFNELVKSLRFEPNPLRCTTITRRLTQLYKTINDYPSILDVRVTGLCRNRKCNGVCVSEIYVPSWGGYDGLGPGCIKMCDAL